MNNEATEPTRPSNHRVKAGIVAPAIVQIVTLLIIIGSTSGDGTFAGMLIFYMSPIIVSVTAGLNWLLSLLLPRDSGAAAYFVLGLFLPWISCTFIWRVFTLH